MKPAIRRLAFGGLFVYFINFSELKAKLRIRIEAAKQDHA
jgi:hypothetical protein